MKWLYQISGLVTGSFTGLIVGGSVSCCFSGGNPLESAFIAIVTVPIGMALGIACGLKGATWARRYLEQGLCKAPKRTRALYLASIVICIVGFNVGCFNVGQQAIEPPSDRRLIADFEPHRDTLEQLAAMASQDKSLDFLSGDSYRFNNNDNKGLKAERLARYRQLLKDACVVRRVQRSTDSSAIELPSWMVGGLVSSSKTKGYLYTETPPSPLFSTLDGIKRRGGSFRHITGNWYLYYQYFPH